MNNKENYSGLTLTVLEKAIKDYYQDKELKGERIPSVTHDTWEEDGKKFSAWIIDDGKNIIQTGDRGKKLYDEEMEKLINERFRDNNNI